MPLAGRLVTITCDNPGAMEMAISMSRDTSTSPPSPEGWPLMPSSSTLLNVTLGRPARFSQMAMSLAV